MSKKNNNNQSTINDAVIGSLEINVGAFKDDVTVWSNETADRVMLTINGVTFMLDKRQTKIIRSIIKNEIGIDENSNLELSDQYSNVYSIKIRFNGKIANFTLTLLYEERVKNGEDKVKASAESNELNAALKTVAKYVF